MPRFALSAVAFLLLCLSGFSAATSAHAARLNVLLITSDDLGLQLGCYGDKVIQTPNIDALAAGSVRFQNAWVAQASCSPSRSAMFTGLYPHTNGQYALVNSGYSLHSQYRDRTIPNLLKRAGYRTGLLGKLHVAPESSFQFDWRPKVDTRQVEKLAQTAGEFLGQPDDGPFFLMVNFSDPHWDRNGGKGPWFFKTQVNGVPEKPLTAQDVQPFPFQGYRAPQHLERIAGYFNAIQRLDVGVGRLLAELEASGHAGDTLVLFVGDHGPPFARGKTTCYEAGLRVPYLVRWPGVSGQFASNALVSTVDLLPTILDAAGVEAPSDLQGRSLRPVVSDPASKWREYLAGEFHSHGRSPFFPRRAIRDGRYKLIVNLRAGEVTPQTGMDGDPGWNEPRAAEFIDPPHEAAYERWHAPPRVELYDLQNDPWELRNLAGEASLAAVQARLEQALADWRQQTADPLLRPEAMQAMTQYAEGK